MTLLYHTAWPDPHSIWITVMSTVTVCGILPSLPISCTSNSYLGPAVQQSIHRALHWPAYCKFGTLLCLGPHWECPSLSAPHHSLQDSCYFCLQRQDEIKGHGMAGQAQEIEDYHREAENKSSSLTFSTSSQEILQFCLGGAPVWEQLLTFVERRFSGLVGDVGLSPSLQQGEQAVQVAPAGGQVQSCLLIEGALVDGAWVRWGGTGSPESLWHVVQRIYSTTTLLHPWWLQFLLYFTLLYIFSVYSFP